ncbi:MAG: hypothetical protein KatS3mg090_0037 [Patescibacteria group bacterium]|nr:MAG: hypothetical protein KatS3mg090_0037 [Patescibacteria group bacterium]
MLTKTKAQITEKKQLNNDTVLIKLKTEQAIEFTAGQYLIIDIQKDGQIFKRLYSIASPDFQNKDFDLIIQLVEGGAGSEFFKNAKINQTVTVTGPAGHFILRKNNHNKVFLATGTGIAPIRSMLYSYILRQPEEKLELIWGMKNTESLYLIDELNNWQKQQPNFTYKLCLSRETSDNPACFRGHLQDYINQNKDKLISDTTDFYICGNRDMTEEVKNLLLKLGAKPNQIYFEKF